MVDDSDRSPHVLLVGGVVEDLCETFEAAGFFASSVDSADACLARLAGGSVDAVVSAQRLPDGDGLELLRSVSTEHPRLPFVLVPRDGSELLASRAVAAGADGYVPASESAATVLTRVEEQMASRSSEDVREGEHRYRHLVETSPAPVNLFDASGKIIWGNDAVLEMLGLDERDQLVGRSIFEFIHPEDRDVAEAELREVVEDGRPAGPTRMKLHRDDDELRHILVSTAPGRFRGRPIGQAVVVDVTPVLEAEQRLRDERSFIEDGLDALEDVFFVVDTAGDLRRWNDRALTVSGYSESEFGALSLEDLFVDEDVERVLGSVATVIDEGSDVVEVTVLTKDGETIPYEFRSRRLTGSDGTVTGVVGIGRDVSERRERERQLLVLEQLLRHNVRTDMNVILGLTEDLEHERIDDVQETAGLIHERAGHLFARTERVKELATMLAGPAETVRADLAAIVSQRTNSLDDRYPELRVELDLPDDAVARAVPQVERAVEELVDNAVRHSGSGSLEITVAVECGDSTCRVTVADDGPGIPVRERALLSPDQEIDQLRHGSGIGLWFVYWAARRSGGHVEFSDRGGRGSAVTLELPTWG